MVNYLPISLSVLQAALLVSASPLKERTASTSPAPVCTTSYSQTQNDFTATGPRGSVYEGQTVGMAASDPTYLTYKLVKDAASCEAFCDSESKCKFANLYQDLYPEGETPNDLTPEVQAKYQVGNLTCAIFSKCLSNSSFNNYGGQNDPSFITSSSGYCKSTTCCTNTYQKTQSNFTGIAPRGSVYEGKRMAAAAQDNASYLTYKLVSNAAECQKVCSSESKCKFANLYQDLYPEGETPVDLSPEVQAKYKRGNLTCAIFSKCLSSSSFTNFGGQNDPSYIESSYGFCRGGSCTTK